MVGKSGPFDSDLFIFLNVKGTDVPIFFFFGKTLDNTDTALFSVLSNLEIFQKHCLT